MIPLHLFCDLLDAGIKFDIVQKMDMRPTRTFSLSKVVNGKITLSSGRQPAITDYAWQILGRLNILLYQGFDWDEAPLSLESEPSLDDGMIAEYEIIPRPGPKERTKAMPATSVESVVLVGDYPISDPQTAIVEVTIGGRVRLYSMQLIDTHSFVEIGQHSPLSIPPWLHAKLAAVGYYGESFVKLFGEAQLRLAKRRRRRLLEDWHDPKAENPKWLDEICDK